MKKVLFLFFCFLFLPVFVYAEDRININTASQIQLEELAGIGQVMAERIIEARPFSSVDDLLKVKGIGEKTLKKIKNQGLAYIGENFNGHVPGSDIKKTDDISLKPNIQNLTQITYPAGIIFSEILPSPEGADEQNEWIEIFNENDFEVELSGWKIQDINGAMTAYVFEKGAKIIPQGYLVLKRPETKITLNNTKDGLNLFSPDEKNMDSLIYGVAFKNQSYNRTESGWQWSVSLTPGGLNIIKIEEKSKLLIKDRKFDNNYNSNKVNNEPGPAGVSYGKEFIAENISDNKTSPLFLFFTALFITLLSFIIILFFKLKFKIHPVE